ncbi:MAG: helix-turn-helix domain-containing protein [Terrimicrobiaceae bacterium]|nr:helix-turn-helix domain-containing protein [Terrimicrobiaceae bacterium]
MKPDRSNGQLMLPIGALLASEREKHGIAVEKAAKETRMRPQRIRDMEADDLSHFTNPSYARMFLIAYAKYLGIPMQTIREHLPDRGEPGSEGYQYINAAPGELPSLRRDLVSRPLKRNTALHIFLLITALVVLVGGGGVITYLAITANRLTAAVDKPAPTPEPEPKIVIVEQAPKPDMHLTNLAPGAGQAFEAPVKISAPPTPLPAAVEVEKPAPRQDAAAAPAPPAKNAATDDRAFLLGSTPDPTPQAAH